MKNALALTVLALFVITASLGVVSADAIVAGKVYNADFSASVSGADVNVTCNTTVKSTMSSGDGTYAVQYEDADCGVGDGVTVDASKGGLTGHGATSIIDGAPILLDVNVGIVNVALIPEFGIVAAVVTVLSAITVFFVIRRE